MPQHHPLTRRQQTGPGHGRIMRMAGVIIATLVVVMACTSCNTTPEGEPSKDVADSRAFMDRINTAKKIRAVLL